MANLEQLAEALIGGAARPIWKCRVCRSVKIEFRAWVEANTGEIASYDDDPTYYCPDCDETHKRPCQVDSEGDCVMDERPEAKCIEEAKSDAD